VRNLFTKTLAVVLVVAFCSLTVAPPGLAEQVTDEDREGTASQYGLGTASVLASLPYSIVKFVFATMGGIFGGFTYAFSAGNEKAATAVWDTSMRGTYVLTPKHLKGEEPIRFLGVPPISDGAMPEPVPAPPAPATP
jgi:hypothetical protein